VDTQKQFYPQITQVDADNSITTYARSMNYLFNLRHLWIKRFCFVDNQETLKTAALRTDVERQAQPLEDILRRVVREELQHTAQ